MDHLEHFARGINHAAFPTFEPAKTVTFYRDVLGFPIAHAIAAKGWGPLDHPDFIHFFFDIGNGDRIAFFYYFGTAPASPEGQGDVYARLGADVPGYFVRSRHLAIHVEGEAQLLEYRRRLDASPWKCEMQVAHETIESIYVHDPNGYYLEFTCPLRPITQQDTVDANLTIEALLDTFREEAPSLQRMWAHKAARIGGRGISPATTLMILDVPEFAPIAKVAAQDPAVSMRKVGAFFELSKAGPIVIDRRATGCRHAVWYSAVAGVRGGRITQYDKDGLKVEPS